jgi:hypothetical protein
LDTGMPVLEELLAMRRIGLIALESVEVSQGVT